MRLSWVELRDFRNHRLTKLDPMPDGLIVAVGPNGEGKTNLLEGIHFLYALGSPRTSTNGRFSFRMTSSTCGRCPPITHSSGVLMMRT